MTVEDAPNSPDRAASRTGRQRIQKLARAALNADETVGQLETVLAGMGETLDDLNQTLSVIGDLTPRMLAVVDRMEGVVGRMERIVGVVETLLSPVMVTESAVRGMFSSVQAALRPSDPARPKSDAPKTR